MKHITSEERHTIEHLLSQNLSPTSIDKRPGVVDERNRLGDLEIDLMIGSGHSGAILTIN